MMPLSRLLFTVFLFISLPIISVAQESTAPSQTNAVQQIVSAIPFDDMLEESPSDLHQQFSQNPFGLPPSQNEKMMEIFLETFTADTLSDYIRQTFEAEVNTTHAQAVNEWFNQQKNQSLLDAEREYYTIDGIRKRIINKYEMEQDPPSAERKELLAKLAQSKSAVETELQTQVILFRSLVQAFGILNPQRTFSDAQIEGFVNNFRNQAQMQIKRETEQKLMLQFHGIDNALIRDYQSFYESEAGHWLSQTTAKALKSAYKKASDEFLQSIENL